MNELDYQVRRPPQPRQLRVSRVRIGIFLAIGVAWTAGSLSICVVIGTDPGGLLIGLINLAMAIALVVVFGQQLRTPPTLTLDREGFTLHQAPARPLRQPWHGCGPFTAYRSTRGSSVIVESPAFAARSRIMSRVNRFLLDGCATIPTGFDGYSAGALAALLNDYRDAYGDNPVSAG